MSVAGSSATRTSFTMEAHDFEVKGPCSIRLLIGPPASTTDLPTVENLAVAAPIPMNLAAPIPMNLAADHAADKRTLGIDSTEAITVSPARVRRSPYPEEELGTREVGEMAINVTTTCHYTDEEGTAVSKVYRVMHVDDMFYDNAGRLYVCETELACQRDYLDEYCPDGLTMETNPPVEEDYIELEAQVPDEENAHYEPEPIAILTPEVMAIEEEEPEEEAGEGNAPVFETREIPATPTPPATLPREDPTLARGFAAMEQALLDNNEQVPRPMLIGIAQNANREPGQAARFQVANTIPDEDEANRLRDELRAARLQVARGRFVPPGAREPPKGKGKAKGKCLYGINGLLKGKGKCPCCGKAKGKGKAKGNGLYKGGGRPRSHGSDSSSSLESSSSRSTRTTRTPSSNSNRTNSQDSEGEVPRNTIRTW